MKLKTLKDLKKEMADITLKKWGISGLGIVSSVDLKKEAIKWIKSIAKGEGLELEWITIKPGKESYEVEYLHNTSLGTVELTKNQEYAIIQIGWIMNFFNILDIDDRGLEDKFDVEQ